jgi:hypothetical protein
MRAAPKSPVIIVSHAACIDGVASDWVVTQHLAAAGRKNITRIPYSHAAAAVAEAAVRAALKPDTEIYFVDMIPTKSFLDTLMQSGMASSINVFDHHRSAIAALGASVANLGGNAIQSSMIKLDVRIDQTRRSAAQMIWDFLMPGLTPPPILSLIDKMDGDAKGLVTEKDFSAAAFVDTLDISRPERGLVTMRGLAKRSFNAMACKGAGVFRDQQANISKLLAEACMINAQVLPGEPSTIVPIVNGNVRFFGRGISERLVGLAEANGAGVAFAWSTQSGGQVTMSIRSAGNIDASLVATHLCNTMGVTGGGHEHAAAVHFASLAEFSKHIVPTGAVPKRASVLPVPR